MTLPKAFRDRIAFMRGGWAVRFRGCIEAARWEDEGAAQAHLRQLQLGYRKPQPEARKEKAS